MASQDRAERLRQAIVEAAARLEATANEPKRGGGPAPGDLYVFNTPVEAAIEWLVVRFHVDDPAILLLAPADDLPLAGQCDVGLWPEFLDRPLTVRCGESAWLPASMCADYLRVGMLPEEAVGEVRRVIAALARGNMPNDAVRELAEADPEYMAWLDEAAHARQPLEDRADSEPMPDDGVVLKVADLDNSPPAWLAAEPSLALAASPGGSLTAALAESLASAVLELWAAASFNKAECWTATLGEIREFLSTAPDHRSYYGPLMHALPAVPDPTAVEHLLKLVPYF